MLHINLRMARLCFVVVLVLVVAVQVYGFALQTGRFADQKKSTLSMKFDLNRAVNTLSRNKILTQTAQLGLLTRLEKAGFTVSSAIPLLKLADELDLIGVLEASSDEILPLIGTAIDFSPKLLPLAAPLLKTPPTTLFAGAAASAATAAALITVIPDDSIVSIALQTALAVPLGVILPGALGAGGLVLSKIK